jgi:hypothetical protein
MSLDIETGDSDSSFNLIQWRDDAKSTFPALHLWAFDEVIPVIKNLHTGTAQCGKRHSSDVDIVKDVVEGLEGPFGGPAQGQKRRLEEDRFSCSRVRICPGTRSSPSYVLYSFNLSLISNTSSRCSFSLSLSLIVLLVGSLLHDLPIPCAFLCLEIAMQILSVQRILSCFELLQFALQVRPIVCRQAVQLPTYRCAFVSIAGDEGGK